MNAAAVQVYGLMASMVSADTGGPSLETYVETRLNLLLETLKERSARQDDTVLALAESFRVAIGALKATVDAAQTSADLRYQQRFEAQSDALAAAFLSQQTAMQTAFVVAEKAVQAALAAADRAVAKAEAAADKRFEALNELRQMLNDMVASLLTKSEALQRFEAGADKLAGLEARLVTMEGRINTLTGSIGGEGQSNVERRSQIATAAQIVAGLVGIIVLLVLLWRAFSGN